MIQEQVRLPVRVAFEVVMQGIRIRFGRSLVTIMGVMLGIAFLMSILTGQALRRGVSEEERQRIEVGRMADFLAAEMGPPAGRTIGLIVTGPMSDSLEERLLRLLENRGVAAVNWAGYGGASLSPTVFTRARVENQPLQRVADSASAVLVMGAGEVPAVDWDGMLAQARQRVVAVTRRRQVSGTGATVVNLERELQPEELDRVHAAARRERYRGQWIVTVSLLVTLIGIANAMLMSVTERFREIGTMKCLGALSAFVRLMFLIESGFMGIVGGVSGCALGFLFSFTAYAVTYGLVLTLVSLAGQIGWLLGYMGVALLAGVVLSVIAAIYPAGIASRMVPADALRSNV